MFHELSSTKIDGRVDFPLDSFDVSDFLSGPMTHSRQYELQSFVCHTGGTTSGHYTAYARHPSCKEWFYFNDEVCTQQNPSDSDINNAYILFYRRQGKNHIKFCEIREHLNQSFVSCRR